MHREQKIGLGLGVLLVGVVAAFFFRNDRDPADAPPRLHDTTIVDRRISERPLTPYLAGVEPAPAGPNPATLDGSLLASHDPGRDARARDPFDLGPAPDPIAPLASPASAADPRTGTAPAAGRPGTPIPRDNNAWSPRPARSATQNPPMANSPSTGGTAADPAWRYHVVEKGDTLTGIAGRYLGNTGRFLDVYRYNQDVLANPNALQVGMKLRIPPAHGQPAERPPARTPAAPTPPAVPTRDGPTAETAPGARPVSTSRPTSPAADAATDLLWPAESSPPAEPEGQGAPETKRFVPVPRSPLNPGPRRLSQIPPDDLPGATP